MYRSFQAPDLRAGFGRTLRTFGWIAATWCLGLMWGSDARALSCAPPNLAQDFQRFNASPDRYILVQGALQYPSGEPVGQRRSGGLPQSFVARAQFSGSYFNGGALTVDVAINVLCFATWCGALPTAGATQIFFLKQETQSLYSLTLSPCPDHTVAENTPQNRAQIARCLQGAC